MTTKQEARSLVERLQIMEPTTAPGKQFNLPNVTPWLTKNWKLRVAAADTITDLLAENERLRDALKSADELADRVKKVQDGWPHKPGYIEDALAAYIKARE